MPIGFATIARSGVSWNLANTARIELSQKVGAVKLRQRIEDKTLIIVVVPEEIFSLGEFVILLYRSIHRLKCVGVHATIICFGRNGHRRGREVLHLLEVEV